MDVERAANMYGRGLTLRQIGAELGVHWSTVSQQLQQAGITMRSGAPPAHSASTQQIMELRDQGLTWNEIATSLGEAEQFSLQGPFGLLWARCLSS